MWVLQGHYRSERDFSWEGLEAARVRRLGWRNRIAKARQTEVKGENPESIVAAASDDLGSPAGFALVDNTELDLAGWEIVDGLFGLGLIENTPDISEECKILLAEREMARAQKDFAKSDELRNKLTEYNIAVLDTPDGQVWQYVR
jgi:cysteinyl-tRNA synthetase